MSQALLIILGVYLLACYAYGMLILYRLWSQKTVIRPTSRLEPTELIQAAKKELANGEQQKRAAA